MQHLNAEFNRVLSEASDAPISDPEIHVEYDPFLNAITFNYPNIGDYNLDGEVSVADITPLALSLGHVVGDGENDEQDSWLDGDGDGEVGVSDVTPIALRFMDKATEFTIYSFDPNNVEDTEFMVASVAFDPTKVWPDGTIRFTFENLPTPGLQFRVQFNFTGPRRGGSSEWPDGWEPREGKIRPYTNPITGQAYLIVDGELWISIRSPYVLESPEVQAFISAEGVEIFNYWPPPILGPCAHIIIPSSITVEQAVVEWPEKYSQILTYVGAIAFGVGQYH